MAHLRLYDYPASPNCLKPRILLAQLGLAYERVEIDIFDGDTLGDAFRTVNPARQTPVLEVDGRYLPQSNAILWYLAEGTPCLPQERFDRASVVRWLTFEQECVGDLAALRFRLKTGILAPDTPAAEELRSGASRALGLLEAQLSGCAFLAGDGYTIGDLANYCYVHLAPEAGLDLDDRPALRDWIARVEAQPGFVNDLAPLPETVGLGRGLSIYG